MGSFIKLVSKVYAASYMRDMASDNGANTIIVIIAICSYNRFNR